MFSWDSNLFEIEENNVEFQEVCSRLKEHPFPSPWQLFFNNSDTKKFIPEVSEFSVGDEDFKASSPLLVDNQFDPSADISNKNTVSSDILIEKKKVSKLKESLMSAHKDSTVEHLKDFDVIFTTSSSQIPLLFQMLDISTLNDASLSLILNAFLHYKDQISIATATALVHHIICPLIFGMKKNSSHFLLTVILKFSETYPKAVIDEMIVPYSKDETSDDLQSEIIFQITKSNLPNEYVSYAIKNLLEHALPVDNTFTLLQSLIERKVHHDTELNDMLLKKLLSWTTTCSKNVKFTKLLTSILSTYGNELTENQIMLCDEAVKSNKTIIKKAAENLLRRLKNENV